MNEGKREGGGEGRGGTYTLTERVGEDVHHVDVCEPVHLLCAHECVVLLHKALLVDVVEHGVLVLIGHVRGNLTLCTLDHGLVHPTVGAELQAGGGPEVVDRGVGVVLLCALRNKKYGEGESAPILKNGVTYVPVTGAGHIVDLPQRAELGLRERLELGLHLVGHTLAAVVGLMGVLVGPVVQRREVQQVPVPLVHAGTLLLDQHLLLQCCCGTPHGS